MPSHLQLLSSERSEEERTRLTIGQDTKDDDRKDSLDDANGQHNCIAECHLEDCVVADCVGVVGFAGLEEIDVKMGTLRI